MVAIYARQSVEKKDSISIESQIEFCKNKLLQDEDFRIYTDIGYSGKNTHRPEYSRMTEDIRLGKISKVMVYKVDRISRAIVDFSSMMEMFSQYDVEFVSATQPIDTTNPMGKAMLSVIMIFAQLERETIQQRIKDNYYERGSKGFYLGGKAPFGYDKIRINHMGKGTYTFSSNIFSNVVINLYEKYTYLSTSLGELSDYLLSIGQKTTSGKSWSTATISRMLRNPVYVKANAEVYCYLKKKGATMNNDVSEYNGENGCYVYGERGTKSKFTDLTGGFVTLGLHKGIVSADLWLRCQRKLDKNKQLKNSGKSTHTWLSGLIKCGYCGYAINVVNNSKGASYINCGGKKLKICMGRKRVIHIKDIEAIAECLLFEELASLNDTEVYDSINSNAFEINKLKAEKIKATENIVKLLSFTEKSSEITAGYLNSKILELDKVIKEVDILIENLTYSGLKKQCFDLKGLIKDWKNYSLEKKKMLACILIENITVTDEIITVNFY